MTGSCRGVRMWCCRGIGRWCLSMGASGMGIRGAASIRCRRRIRSSGRRRWRAIRRGIRRSGGSWRPMVGRSSSCGNASWTRPIWPIPSTVSPPKSSTMVSFFLPPKPPAAHHARTISLPAVLSPSANPLTSPN